MKKAIILLVLSVFALSAMEVRAQHEVKPFEHLSVSLNAGTLGAGIQVAAPVNRYLSLRTGLMIFKYTHDYDYKEVIHYPGYTNEGPVPMEAKANMVNGLLLADFFPFANKRIHVTGGFFVGSSDIVKVSGDDPGRVVEIADVIIEPDVNGRVAAQIETNAFKPYLGIGFGSSVTKSKRVGFKFELGAMFHGSPKVVVTEGKLVSKDDLSGLITDDELSSFNKFLKNFNVYPVMNFQLNFRAF